MASKKTKYTLHLDIPLLKEIINYNPFANPKKWQAVADALTENIDGAPATGWSCKERALLLIVYIKKEQLAKINK